MFGNYKNFTLSEFTVSNKARELGIDNTPSDEIVEHLDELTNTILQPLRDDWGSGVIVSSGYRCKKLNKAVGGSETSVHPTGYAADIVPSNGEIDEFIRFCRFWFISKAVGFDQLLLERNSAGEKWVHIGLYNNAHQQRKQIKNMYVA